ncbi:hypothetical protein ACVCAH_35745 [Micromonospora sp. LZ34]
MRGRRRPSELLDEHGARPADVIVSGPPWVAFQGSGPTIIASDDSPSGMGGELLGACLALLVGVVGVMLLDREPARRLIAVVLAAGRPRHRAWIRVRAPTLAQLCLLRM